MGDIREKSTGLTLSLTDFSVPSSDSAAVLRGGGRMGELMRSIDWSQTPVGAIQLWPQSLRTALSILLDTHFPMYIAWGKEFTQFYNDGYRPILGATKHPAAMGRSTRESFSEIWEIIGPMFEDVMHGKAVGVTDFMLPMDRNGFVEECYFIFSYSPIRDESGEVGGVLVTVTETTQRVIGERRLKSLRELAGRASEAKDASSTWQQSADALASNPDDLPFGLFYSMEPDGRTARLVAQFGLPAGCRAAPPSVDTSQTNSALWPLGISPGTQVRITDVEERFGSLAGAKWPEPVREAVVCPIVRPGMTNPFGYLVAAISPRLAWDDDYRGFLNLVSEHVASACANAHAYEEEKKRAQALAEIDQAKTAFFSNVSHEFRTPLALMLGPLEEWRAAGGDRLWVPRDELDLVHRNSLRLLKLVNTLLDFSRIEAGRMQAVFEPTDLATSTTELVGVFRSAVAKAGLSLSVDCPPLSELAYVDKEMWEKIVLNLLSNALKHTFSGGIMVSLRTASDGAELTVKDSGIGIAEEDLPHIFDRFHRIKNARSRSHEGTGIGLALVRELIKQHKGSIHVESQPGEGTIFTVTIPLGKNHLPADRVGVARELITASAGAIPFVEEALRWLTGGQETLGPAESVVSGFEGSAAVAPSATTALGQRGMVLVVDDNADLRQYVCGLLSPHWEVSTAPDGLSALEFMKTQLPDLVLSDVMMPGMDGLAMLEAIRRDPRTRHIPLILLSARAGEESRVEGLEKGADDYLVKPFSAKELIARVSAHMKLNFFRREAERDLHALAEFMPTAISRIDRSLRVQFVNAAAARIIGSNRDAIIGKTPEDLRVPRKTAERLRELVREVFEQGAIATLEFAYLTPQGWRRYEMRLVPEFSPDGRVEQVMTISEDVTERKRAERLLLRSRERLTRWNLTLEREVARRTEVLQEEIRQREKAEAELKRSLFEKEVLLKEVHHRVKNNMQVISSLLRLQSADLQEEKWARMFLDSQSRIQSMALVHDLLYRSGRFDEVDIRLYFRDLARYLLGVFKQPGDISFECVGDSITLHMDQAIPCALIMTEIMTNALKHGFSAPVPQAFIRAVLGRDGNNEVFFSLENNGLPLPSSITTTGNRGLGMRVIEVLTKQIRGRLRISRRPHTKFLVSFPARTQP